MGDGGEKNTRGTKKLQKSYFDVWGLCCSSEVALIEKILKPVEGVMDVSFIFPSRTLIVLHDNLLVSQLHIVKLLNQARLEANIRAHSDESYEKRMPSPHAIACGVLLLLSFLKFVYRPFQWLSLGAVAVGICPMFLRALASLRNWTLDSNILVLIAVVGSIALHDYWEAASIVFLFTIAQWLEARASHKATSVMSSLVNIVPEKAVLVENGEEVDADEVKLDTIIAVKAGEIIPIDGVVVEGRCEVDEKTLTGESFPVSKQIHSTVLAGTINLNGYISVRTTALAEDCVVARMAKLVEAAQNQKSKTQMFIDHCAKVYTPAVVIMSCGLVAVPFTLRLENKSHWFHLALVVLVSACPCALILSTPVATFCALSKAATLGLLIKGGEYLETLSKIKIMAFDKTGTITRGEFIVTEFLSLSGDVTTNTLLYWVSSIESKSSHPMASALIYYAQTLSIDPKPERVEEFENFPGEGIHGKIEGIDVYVGNRKIALRAGCARAPSLEGHNKGKSIGYIFLGAVPAGIFSLSDTCRSGVKEAMNELKSMRIKTAMLTGDSHEAAILAQNQLVGALDVVHYELLPEDKAHIISLFQKEAPTAMVGDGLNDSPALATADIGISMGISGSALAIETCNVILMSNDIRKIPKVIRLARKTQWKVIQNVFFSILTKTIVLALAFKGHPLVWAAVLADVGTCLVVIFNSMLLLKGNDKHAKCCKSSSPSSPHVHKHGSIPHRCHSSHENQNGCFDVSEAQTESGHQHNSEHSDHGNTGTVTPCVASNEIHKHGCKEKGCTILLGSSHIICVSGDGNHMHGGEHCDHENNTNENQTAESRMNKSYCGITQSMTMDDHCRLIHCFENPAQDYILDREVCNVPKTGCQNTDSEACFECNKHLKEIFSPCHPIADSSLGSNHMECAASGTCLSSEKRQIGGCCTSFRKDCCGKAGHFATSFRGGLSEITID